MESKIAPCIDHTLLRPEASSKEVLQLCEEALKYKFAAVCVSPSYVTLAYKTLMDSPVKVVSVAGFPLGANLTEIKALEAKRAVGEGASEIDMVMNIGAFKNGETSQVREDIEAVVEASKPAPVKVIVETALLNTEEKKNVCLLIKESRAAFIKTSTGFIPGGGAHPEDIKLFWHCLGQEKGIKASGGIRDLPYARRLLDCGATRIGTSSGVDIILEELKE